jgi:hypothetical protein
MTISGSTRGAAPYARTPTESPVGRFLRLRTKTPWADTATVMLVLTLVACGDSQAARRAFEAHADAAPSGRSSRLVACTLITAAEMSELAGQTYTQAESADDGKETSSDCHYHNDIDPTGANLQISWISARDYSDPVEHAALQNAMVGGARLAGKLTGPIASTGGLRTGPISGVGDEAYLSMGMLTARKGDVSIMVQISPADMSAFVQDTAVSGALVEREKAVALKVISKL